MTTDARAHGRRAVALIIHNHRHSQRARITVPHRPRVVRGALLHPPPALAFSLWNTNRHNVEPRRTPSRGRRERTREDERRERTREDDWNENTETTTRIWTTISTREGGRSEEALEERKLLEEEEEGREATHRDAPRRNEATTTEGRRKEEEKKRTEGDAFESTVAMDKEEGVAFDVSPPQDGGVMKTIITEAPANAPSPEAKDVVEVHYTGTLTNGEKFDSSRDRGDPFTFTLGTHQVINAWDVGVATMKVGERAKFECKAEYAYGERGSPPKIPPNATLIFDVELLSFKSHRDLSGDGGVVKEDVTPASGFSAPTATDEVRITYDVKAKDGETVIVEEQTVTCDVAKAPCEGVGIALLKMKKGEKVRLTLSGTYAKGLPAPADADGAVVTVALDAIHTVVPLSEHEGTKKVLEDGEGYEKPNEGAKCSIEYEQRSADGTVVKSETLDIVVGDENVPDELDAAIMMMKLKEKALVRLANGTEYTVSLNAMERAKEQYSMNSAEKIEAAETYKASGNDAYKGGKFARASKKYAAALKFVEFDSGFSDEEKQASKKLKLSLNLNSAAVAIKTKSWTEARQASQKALDIESSNEKALYRYAQATMEMHEYDESRRSLKKILEQDESHAEAQRMMKRLKALEAHQAKKDAKIFGGMFSKIDLYDKAELEAMEKKEVEDDADSLDAVKAANAADEIEVPPMDAPPAPDAGEPMEVTQV